MTGRHRARRETIGWAAWAWVLGSWAALFATAWLIYFTGNAS